MNELKCCHGSGPECAKCEALDIPEVEEMERETDTLRRQNAALRGALERINTEMDTITQGKQEDVHNDFSSGEAHGWSMAQAHVGQIIHAALALTPAAPDETAGALAAIGMFDAALRAAKGGGK